MLDLALIEEKQIKSLCKEPLDSVSTEDIIQLAMALFPVQSVSDPIDLLYKNMVTYYNLRIEKKIDFDTVTKQVVKKAKQKSIKLYIAICQIFKSQFADRFKKRILKPRGLIRPAATNGQINLTQNTDSTDRKVFAFGTQVNSQVNEANNSKLPNEISKISLGLNDNKSVSSYAFLTQTNDFKIQTALKEIKRAPLTLAVNNTVLNSNLATESGPVTNLSDQDMCFCRKHVSLIENSKESSFLCIHCKKRYHTQCMKRQASSKMCSFCHLRKMIPNRETKKVLFVGLLQKGRKRHQISLNLSQEDLSIQFKIQVRCFRIKEGCQNSVLFPDSATVTMKWLNLKEFIPLHRQSSLKYRKDEPFYISTGLHVKENKIILLEKHPGKQTKDQRIVLENHLLGIYLIEQKKVEWMVREIKENCFTNFSESKDLLDTCFKKGSVGDQISCQIIKIPLTCSLTTEKLKLPARGIFCNHFHCFDLKNFLELTVASINPRWLCPVCKIPTYEFKVDIIILTILQLQKQNPNAVEAIFLKTGEFKVFEPDDKQCVSSIRNIYDLPIEGMLKRAANHFGVEDSQKRKQKSEIILE